jgi:thiol:disulfide interchange protein
MAGLQRSGRHLLSAHQARFHLAAPGGAVVRLGPASPVEPAGESTPLQNRTLKTGSFWAVVVTFFGFGLLLALTPACSR